MLRTVKWWVIYSPQNKVLMRQPFRTKKQAVEIQRGSATYADCVVFQVKGHYVRPPGKKASTTGE